MKRRSGKQRVDGKSFRLADEVRYIQNKAADHNGYVVTLGQLVLFSTDTGEPCLLDVTDQLAARLAPDGDPDPIHLEETDTNFTSDGRVTIRIAGPAFIYCAYRKYHRDRIGTESTASRSILQSRVRPYVE